MTEISRRLVLGSAVGGAAVSLLPPSLHTAMAQPVRRSGLRAIEHVIVLMQENRSFDHYYGTLRGVRGYGDRQPLRLRDGKSAYHCSTNPNRNYLWSCTTGYEPGTTQRAVTNAAYDYNHQGYDWTAYPERLEQAGVSWQIYQEWGQLHRQRGRVLQDLQGARSPDPGVRAG